MWDARENFAKLVGVTFLITMAAGTASNVFAITCVVPSPNTEILENFFWETMHQYADETKRLGGQLDKLTPTGKIKSPLRTQMSSLYKSWQNCCNAYKSSLHNSDAWKQKWKKYPGYLNDESGADKAANRKATDYFTVFCGPVGVKWP